MSPFYYYLWGLYGLAGLGLLYLGWRFCRLIKPPVLAYALFALFAALLFTPAKVIPEQLDLTPALVVSILDALTQGWTGAWNGLKLIFLVYAGLLVLAVPLGLLRGKALKRRAAGAAESQ